MSYDMVIEQVKALPEQLLTSVSAFIKLLEAEQPKKTCSKNSFGHKEKFLWFGRKNPFGL